MIRPTCLGLACLVALSALHVRCLGAEKDLAQSKQWQALLGYFKAQGIDLRDAKKQGGYIQRQFTIGPDHTQDHLVGFNYLPPLTLKEAEDEYMQYSLPYEFHGDWAIITVGVPHGTGEGYEADWKKVQGALRKFASRTKASK